jgi:hypothetical protein
MRIDGAAVVEQRQRMDDDAAQQVGHSLARPVEVRDVDDDEEEVEARGRLCTAGGGHDDRRKREPHERREVAEERVDRLPVDEEQARKPPGARNRRADQDELPVVGDRSRQHQQRQHRRGSGQVEDARERAREAAFLSDVKRVKPALHGAGSPLKGIIGDSAQ